ncbi:MAG: N(4)-(beta-N-acetylglucosaminyl)-L-asparaginase [Bryobacteraceae bacterium]|nr:N(4)-(beta-N-acetylglucosaminyl)-L-asparaginase [Bryobacteraceae bacterium]
MNRRQWLTGTAAMAAAASQASAQGAKNVVISSANGLRACARAMEILTKGGDTLDAVIAGVNINEEDPEDDSVGYGGLPNEEGVVELDASVMHGPTRRAGSVAGIRNIKYPSKVARMVMERTDHIMLVGEGALRFAKAMGFPEENLLTEKSRLAWLVWKQTLRDRQGHSNWSDGLDAPPAKQSGSVPTWLRQQFPEASEEWLAYALDRATYPITGTINCLALNAKGEMSGVTTTSGLSWKLPGRVGDSPIIGAGLYVDQEVGGGGSTGRGEENIRVAGAHTIVENMRKGMSPKEACLDTLKRISRNYDDDKARLTKFDITFYALRKDGVYGAASLFRGPQRQREAISIRKFAVNDGGASRLEDCAFLYER